MSKRLETLQMLLAVGAGGCLGTLTRAATAHAWPTTGLPLATLAVNLVGAFALGLLLGALAGREGRAQRVLRLGVGTGFMGGLTTYSTFVLQVHGLVHDGGPARAATYLLGSLAARLTTTAVGLWAGSALATSRAGAGQEAGT